MVAAVFLGLREDAVDDEVVLSLLQLESRQSGLGRTSGLTFSRPVVVVVCPAALCPWWWWWWWWRSARHEPSLILLQPKSGRRMLSMKKLVVLLLWLVFLNLIVGQ